MKDSISIRLQDFKDICRTCLERGNLVSMWQLSIMDSVTIGAFLNVSFSLNINESDGLPTNVCWECVNKLLKLYEFRQQCLQNDRILRALRRVDSNMEKVVVTQFISTNVPPFIARLEEVDNHNCTATMLPNSHLDDRNNGDGLRKKIGHRRRRKNAIQLSEEQRTRLSNFRTYNILSIAKRNKIIESISRQVQAKICKHKQRIERKQSLQQFRRSKQYRRPFLCLHCNRRFPLMYLLKRHRKTHIAPTPSVSVMPININPKLSSSNLSICKKKLVITKQPIYTQRGIFKESSVNIEEPPKEPMFSSSTLISRTNAKLTQAETIAVAAITSLSYSRPSRLPLDTQSYNESERKSNDLEERHCFSSSNAGTVEHESQSVVSGVTSETSSSILNEKNSVKLFKTITEQNLPCNDTVVSKIESSVAHVVSIEHNQRNTDTNPNELHCSPNTIKEESSNFPAPSERIPADSPNNGLPKPSYRSSTNSPTQLIIISSNEIAKNLLPTSTNKLPKSPSKTLIKDITQKVSNSKILEKVTDLPLTEMSKGVWNGISKHPSQEICEQVIGLEPQNSLEVTYKTPITTVPEHSSHELHDDTISEELSYGSPLDELHNIKAESDNRSMQYPLQDTYGNLAQKSSKHFLKEISSIDLKNMRSNSPNEMPINSFKKIPKNQINDTLKKVSLKKTRSPRKQALISTNNTAETILSHISKSPMEESTNQLTSISENYSKNMTSLPKEVISSETTQITKKPPNKLFKNSTKNASTNAQKTYATTLQTDKSVSLLQDNLIPHPLKDITTNPAQEIRNNSPKRTCTESQKPLRRNSLKRITIDLLKEKCHSPPKAISVSSTSNKNRNSVKPIPTNTSPKIRTTPLNVPSSKLQKTITAPLDITCRKSPRKISVSPVKEISTNPSEDISTTHKNAKSVSSTTESVIPIDGDENMSRSTHSLTSLCSSNGISDTSQGAFVALSERDITTTSNGLHQKLPTNGSPTRRRQLRSRRIVRVRHLKYRSAFAKNRRQRRIQIMKMCLNSIPTDFMPRRVTHSRKLLKHILNKRNAQNNASNVKNGSTLKHVAIDQSLAHHDVTSKKTQSSYVSPKKLRLTHTSTQTTNSKYLSNESPTKSEQHESDIEHKVIRRRESLHVDNQRECATLRSLPEKEKIEIKKNEESFNVDLAPTSLLDVSTGDNMQVGNTRSRDQYRCTKCSKSFSRRANLSSHMLSHSEHKSYQCFECDQSFNNSIFFEQHLSSHENDNRSYSCPTCDKVYQKKHLLLQHRKSHSTTRKLYKCDKCDNTYAHYSNFSYHLKTHTGFKPYACSYCKKGFIAKGHMDCHIRVHTGEKPYKCTQCSKQFGQAASLRMHMRSAHDHDTVHKCEFCSRSFPIRSMLIAHTRKHTREKPFKCLGCERAFGDITTLRRHEMIHSGVKPYKCSHCERTFRQRSNLICHTRIHTGNKPYQCAYCDRTFAQKTHLDTHHLSHTGEKPFKCDFCTRAFTRKVRLKEHLRVHTGEKPHQCTVCDKSFSVQSTLKAHLRTHSDERPFVCSICFHACRQKSSLNSHMRVHNNEKSCRRK